VRESAGFTALHSLLGIGEISSAVFAQGIEGAIAEKAVELRLLNPCMAGEIFTFPVLKKLIMLHFLVTQNTR
jgi:hypothetical protein